MYVRYRMNGSATFANMLADINGIVSGSISSTSGLSAGADTGNSAFYGTYPSTFYALANGAGSYTYAKTHNANSSIKNYFTINVSGTTSITGLTHGYNYANSTNTYTTSNTFSFPVAITPQAYAPIDIIVNNDGFFLGCPGIGAVGCGVFDLGYNGVSQAFPNTMISTLLPFINSNNLLTAAATTTITTNGVGNTSVTVASGTGILPGQLVVAPGVIPNYTYVGANSTGTTVYLTNYAGVPVTTTAVIPAAQPISFYTAGNIVPINPYTYYFANAGYGSSALTVNYITPTPVQYNAQGNVAILENPVFATSNATSNAVSLVYSVYKIIEGQYSNRTLYVDGSSVYRYVVTTDTASYSISIY